MRLMLVYVIIVVVIELFAVLLGLQVDKVWPGLSLPIALTLFFGALALGWVLAVWLTERFFSGRSNP